MDIQNKYDQFYEQMNGKPITAENILNAIKATGYAPELKPFYLSYAKAHGVHLDPSALDNLTNAQETARQEKAVQETAANIAEKSGALVNETDMEKRKELVENMRRLTASLGTSAQNKSRIYKAADYLNECLNYDPSKDFTASMLAGLRFPNGSLSYIGARPGGGKSALLVNLAREGLAAERNVHLVNLEMINRAVITNYALSLMYATADEKQRRELDIVNNPMSKYYSLFRQEYDSRETFDLLRYNILKETVCLLDKHLLLYDGTGETVETIISDIESMANAGDIVLIDYLQRILPPRESREQRYIQIKQISNALLTLAKKKNVVIISGAQFGRQAKENRGNEATLEDFREGGDTEQDAHNALAIETITDKDVNDAGRYIHVLKQREGGAAFKRISLHCNFNYLYIAGTGKEYIAEKEPEGQSGSNPKTRQTRGKQNEENNTDKPIAKLGGVNVQ
jgi:archaellum biogenesis ATPase FlaH